MALWVIQALKNMEADVQQAIAYPVQGNTVLHEAANHSAFGMLTFFLKTLGKSAGEVCASLNDFQQTVLHLVALDTSHRLSRRGLLLVLSALGPRVKAIALRPESRGWTPLLMVARNQGGASVTLMLAALEEAAQAACLQANRGWTVLHLVLRYQAWETVEQILQALGDQIATILSVPNERGWTPTQLLQHHHPQACFALDHYTASQTPALPVQAYLENALANDFDDTVSWLVSRAAKQNQYTVLTTRSRATSMLSYAAKAERQRKVSVAKNNDSQSPLHSSKVNGELVELPSLLQRYAQLKSQYDKLIFRYHTTKQDSTVQPPAEKLQRTRPEAKDFSLNVSDVSC